jgi:hypothetical protein
MATPVPVCWSTIGIEYGKRQSQTYSEPPPHLTENTQTRAKVLKIPKQNKTLLILLSSQNSLVLCVENLCGWKRTENIVLVCLFLLLLFTYLFLYSCNCNSFWYLMLLLFCWHHRADGYFFTRVLTNQGACTTILCFTP